MLLSVCNMCKTKIPSLSLVMNECHIMRGEIELRVRTVTHQRDVNSHRQSFLSNIL